LGPGLKHHLGAKIYGVELDARIYGTELGAAMSPPRLLQAQELGASNDGAELMV